MNNKRKDTSLRRNLISFSAFLPGYTWNILGGGGGSGGGRCVLCEFIGNQVFLARGHSSEYRPERKLGWPKLSRFYSSPLDRGIEENFRTRFNLDVCRTGRGLE